MFNPGVTGHDDEGHLRAVSERAAAIDYADPARTAENGFYMIRNMVSEYFMGHLVCRNNADFKELSLYHDPQGSSSKQL